MLVVKNRGSINFYNTLIIKQGGLHIPILPPGAHGDERGNILRLIPASQGASKNGILAPLPIVILVAA
jgi:hypothetical protein